VSPTKLTDATLGERYKVRGFVGCGGMARVYLAEDERSGRPVAVKVLQPPFCDDPAACERFLSEARTVSRIGHPGIVALLEAGVRRDDEAPYVVMEFLYGESLGDYLARNRQLSMADGLPWIRQAASALAAAHKKGIVHRDVKPDNLFLLGEPDEPHSLKVIDFGLSKEQTRQQTAAGMIVGTPEYMAPEQVLAEQVDARTDIYALGVVMYRMLVGQLPYETRDHVEQIAHQVFTPAPPPQRIVPSFDRRLSTVIRTALRKDPNNRYPAMDILFDDLGKLDDPDARLWAGPVEGDRYKPSSRVSEEVARSLARVIGRRTD
jgi:eukaryotic-like serine/threonine-protein kinase